MAKLKIPFRRHQLSPLPAVTYSPPRDKAEGVTATEKGYWPGWNYSDAEKEFMAAVVRWQRKHRSKFLSHSAYLRIALELGYRRDLPPTPPTPAAQMNATTILERMVALGFSFIREADGAVSFRPPPNADSPDQQHLLGVVAWSWAWLADHAGKYVTSLEARQ